MDEWEVNENNVLDMLNKVADAKRAAIMVCNQPCYQHFYFTFALTLY